MLTTIVVNDIVYDKESCQFDKKTSQQYLEDIL